MLDISFLYQDPRTGKDMKVTKFLPMFEAIMHNEQAQSIDAQLIYGVKQNHVGPKGFVKRTGPGLRAQLADGWTEYYNGPLTANRIKDYLLDIFFSRVDEQDRKVVFMTGQLGSMLFHDALASEASSFLTMDTHFVKQQNDGYGNHLAFGGQFTRYFGPEGIEVTLVKNPMYDSTRYDKRNHPLYPGKPQDSARFTVMDFGTSKAANEYGNNIMMLREKNTFSWGWVGGTWTPMGPVRGGQATALTLRLETKLEYKKAA